MRTVLATFIAALATLLAAFALAAQPAAPSAPAAAANAQPGAPAAPPAPAKAQPAAPNTPPATPKAPPNVHLYIGWPNDGQVVQSGKPIRVWFGLRNMGVAPKGVAFPHTGHHHLLIDTDAP